MTIKNKLSEIEKLLFQLSKEMKSPTIAEDLGVLILEATLFEYSNEQHYKDKALTMLENAIKTFESKELNTGFLEGFEGIFWTVHYLNKCKIIHNEDILEELNPYLYQSLDFDISINNFDALHGSINKINYLIESNYISKKDSEKYIQLFIDKLYEERLENEKGIYWFDKFNDKQNYVNLGLAHGISGVLVFLSKLKIRGFNHPKIDRLIRGIFKSLISFKNNGIQSCFPSNYFCNDSSKNNITSRFAWCNGDLGIIFSLLYASKALNEKKFFDYSLETAIYLIDRRISNSLIDHFEEYHFFDTAFCHGISGILYTLIKINNFIDNDYIKKRSDYWKEELLFNLEIQMNINKEIYYPLYKQDSKQSYTLDKNSMLSGLTGTGLVLASLYYNRYDWSDIFLLY